MNQPNPTDLELEHVDLKLTDEQFDTLISFWPPALKESNTKRVFLTAYYKGERYGIVHVTPDSTG